MPSRHALSLPVSANNGLSTALCQSTRGGVADSGVQILGCRFWTYTVILNLEAAGTVAAGTATLIWLAVSCYRQESARMPAPRGQKAKKSITYLIVALAGSPKRSSNQNDLQLPVTEDPALFELRRRSRDIKWRSWRARRRDVYQRRVAQVSSSVLPSIRSMIRNSMSGHSTSMYRSDRSSCGVRMPSARAISHCQQ